MKNNFISFTGFGVIVVAFVVLGFLTLQPAFAQVDATSTEPEVPPVEVSFIYRACCCVGAGPGELGTTTPVVYGTTATTSPQTATTSPHEYISAPEPIIVDDTPLVRGICRGTD